MRLDLRFPSGSEVDAQSHGVRLPRHITAPLIAVLKRVMLAALVMFVAFLLVVLNRGGYYDSQGGQVTVLDAYYYVTVSLSTTGYGDIVPYSTSARLINALIITPLRVLFLVIFVGTTLEVLTERTRDQWRIAHWRKTLRDHTVIVGFGIKGRSAAQTLLGTGVRRDEIVIVDPQRSVVEHAAAEGFAAVTGDATRSSVLLRARIERARQVVIAAARDDTAALVTLTVRQLSTDVRIVASVREAENVPLLRQSGADSVITSASAAGRLLGIAVSSPSSGAVMEDLIHPDVGMALRERPVHEDEAGHSPRESADLVVSVKRGHRLLAFDNPEVATLLPEDRLVVIERVTPEEGGTVPDTAPLTEHRSPPEGGPGTWRIPRR